MNVRFLQLKSPKLKLIKEFKQFITRGNVVDLAVGMIIGAAFTAIVTALVANIFKPLINAIPMGDMEGLITMLVPKDANGVTVAANSGLVDLSKSVYIDWGAFIMAIINFLLTAIVLFGLIKFINGMRNGFGGITAEAKFLGQMTKEEKAELKANGVSRKEIKALMAKRAEEASQAAAAETAPPAESMEDILKDIRALLSALNQNANVKQVEEEAESAEVEE